MKLKSLGTGTRLKFTTLIQLPCQAIFEGSFGVILLVWAFLIEAVELSVFCPRKMKLLLKIMLLRAFVVPRVGLLA